MFPRWLSLIVLVVIGYVLVTGTANHTLTMPTPAAPQASVPTAHSYPEIAAATDTERWKKAVNPDYAAHAQCEFSATKSGLGLKATTDKAGSGEGASCTDRIAVHLTVWSNRGDAFYTGDMALTLGERQVAAGLDAALIGIKPGETRTIILPPEALVRAKKTEAPRALLHALKPDLVAMITATRTE